MVYYSETIDSYDKKVSIYSKLTENMEIYMYQRSGSFSDFYLMSLNETGSQVSDIGPLVLWFDNVAQM